MTAQELKNSVLRRAFRGELVERRAEEGTGAELLKQIEAEKAALTKAGKLKKEKPLPPITEEEKPFEIPERWTWTRLGDLALSIQYGYNAPAQTTGKVRFVRISDIQDGQVQWETVPYCEIADDEIQSYLLRENDILFARTGGTVGKSFLVKSVPERAIYAGYLIRTTYGANLNPAYMKFFMESPLYWNQLRNGTTATAQPNCNGKTLAKMILPLPPLAEQARIVAKLEEIWPEIERYAAARDELEALNRRFPNNLRKAVLQSAIRGELVERRDEEGTGAELLRQIEAEKASLTKAGKLKKEKPLPPITEEEKPFEIPEHWTWTRLGSYCFEVFSGKTPKYSKIPNQYLIIGQAANQQDGIDFSQVKYANEEFWNSMEERYFLRKNDVLLNTLGNGTIGRSGIIEHLEKKLLTDGHLFVFRLCADIASKYFYYYLQYKKRDIEKSANGSTNQIFLSLRNTNSWLVPLPPLAEQARIVAKLEEILPLCDRLR